MSKGWVPGLPGQVCQGCQTRADRVSAINWRPFTKQLCKKCVVKSRKNMWKYVIKLLNMCRVSLKYVQNTGCLKSGFHFIIRPHASGERKVMKNYCLYNYSFHSNFPPSFFWFFNFNCNFSVTTIFLATSKRHFLIRVFPLKSQWAFEWRFLIDLPRSTLMLPHPVCGWACFSPRKRKWEGFLCTRAREAILLPCVWGLPQSQ